LPLIRRPTLVLCDDGDPVVPVANARVLAMLLPRARLVVVPTSSESPFGRKAPLT
jgi:pimeloyl-ACP methyl ester carboxylesterase